jgi:hypothetical protein
MIGLFLIKLHALIEAALSHLLAQLISLSVKKYLPDDKKPTGLEELFSWLELSNKRTGKGCVCEGPRCVSKGTSEIY